MIESSSWPKSLESLEGHERCRITVNNIVQTVQVEGEREPLYFAVLDPRRFKEKQEKRWQPLGGAIQLTDEGKEIIELIGGEMLEKADSNDSHDARFSVGTDKFMQVLQLFSQLRPVVFEETGQREVFEELSHKEFNDFDPILSPEDAARVSCVTYSVLNELPKYEGVAGRFGKDMPYARITYLSSVSMPKDVFENFKKSPLVHIFTKEEVAHIVETRSKGEVARTGGGESLATTTVLSSRNPFVVSSEDSAYLHADNPELEFAIFMSLAKAMKEGRTDFDDVLKNLSYRNGSPANLSDEEISEIVRTDVPDIQALVMEKV